MVNVIAESSDNSYLNIFQDWQANNHSYKGRFVMILFRIAYLVRRDNILYVCFFWYLILYKLLVSWILNIDISTRAKIGSGLKLNYGYGLVIHGQVEIGANCTLRQLTTISNKELLGGREGDCPKIGNNVDIGVNVTIIGDVVIGSNVIIGAGTVITKSVPDHCVIVGNPAHILKRIYQC